MKTKRIRPNGSALAAAQQSQKSAPAAYARQRTPAWEVEVWRRLLHVYEVMTPGRRIAEHRKIVRLASRCVSASGKNRTMRLMFPAEAVVLLHKVGALLKVTPQQFILAVLREHLQVLSLVDIVVKYLGRVRFALDAVEAGLKHRYRGEVWVTAGVRVPILDACLMP